MVEDDERLQRLAGALYQYRRVMYEIGCDPDCFVIPFNEDYERLYSYLRRTRPQDERLQSKTRIDGQNYRYFTFNGLMIMCPIEDNERRHEEERRRRLVVEEEMMRRERMRPMPPIIMRPFDDEEKS